jgi:hypothetical protein
MTHPLLAREEDWDYATNDANGVTPDDVLYGSHRAVSWLCATHGPYVLEVRFRAIQGQGCRDCAKESAHEKRRVTLNARSRDRFALAAKVRERRARDEARRDGPPPDPPGRPLD